MAQKGTGKLASNIEGMLNKISGNSERLTVQRMLSNVIIKNNNISEKEQTACDRAISLPATPSKSDGKRLTPSATTPNLSSKIVNSLPPLPALHSNQSSLFPSEPPPVPTLHSTSTSTGKESTLTKAPQAPFTKPPPIPSPASSTHSNSVEEEEEYDEDDREFPSPPSKPPPPLPTTSSVTPTSTSVTSSPQQVPTPIKRSLTSLARPSYNPPLIPQPLHKPFDIRAEIQAAQQTLANTTQGMNNQALAVTVLAVGTNIMNDTQIKLGEKLKLLDVLTNMCKNNEITILNVLKDAQIGPLMKKYLPNILADVKGKNEQINQLGKLLTNVPFKDQKITASIIYSIIQNNTILKSDVRNALIKVFKSATQKLDDSMQENIVNYADSIERNIVGYLGSRNPGKANAILFMCDIVAESGNLTYWEKFTLLSLLHDNYTESMFKIMDLLRGSNIDNANDIGNGIFHGGLKHAIADAMVSDGCVGDFTKSYIDNLFAYESDKQKLYDCIIGLQITEGTRDGVTYHFGNALGQYIYENRSKYGIQ
jgi:hypothetical protein